ncbi:hypothetical protein C8N34_101560, partial [Gemmobacter caeni]
VAAIGRTYLPLKLALPFARRGFSLYRPMLAI